MNVAVVGAISIRESVINIIFLALVIRQRAALSFATQHIKSQTFYEKLERFKTSFPLPGLLYGKNHEAVKKYSKIVTK